MTDAELAAKLACTAGQILVDLRASGLLSGKPLGVAGDRTADSFLMSALKTLRSEDAVLCEESRSTPGRTKANRVWIVDPLDGTREYSEGREDWAVHVALAIDGVATVGAVALPDCDSGLLLRSDQPSALPPAASPPRIVVSRTRPPREAEAVAQALGGQLVPMGSAGAKAMAVLRGEAEAYVHSGGQYEWDSCAPVAVAMAHGLTCTRLDGSPLRYNCANVAMPDLVICRPELHASILAAARAVTEV